MVFLFRYFALGLLYHYNGQDAAALQVYMYIYKNPYSYKERVLTQNEHEYLINNLNHYNVDSSFQILKSLFRYSYVYENI